MSNFALRPPEMANFQFHHHFETESTSFPQQQTMFQRPATAQNQGFSEELDVLPVSDFPFSEYIDRGYEPYQAMPAPLFSLGFDRGFERPFERPAFDRSVDRTVCGFEKQTERPDSRVQQDYFPEEGPDLRFLMSGLFSGQDSPIVAPPNQLVNPDFQNINVGQPLSQPVQPPPPPPPQAFHSIPSSQVPVQREPHLHSQRPVAQVIQKPPRKRSSRSKPKRVSKSASGAPIACKTPSSTSRSSLETLFSLDLLDLLSLTTSDSASPVKLLESPSPTATYSGGSLRHPDHCRIVRGVASGGCSAPPPQETPEPCEHVKAKLVVGGDLIEHVCNSPWTQGEMKDRRRIVRIERRQKGHRIYADFSIVGCANDNPEIAPPPPGADVIEVSCLLWDKASDENNPGPDLYITSVEVIAIVETLIQSKLMEPSLRRRERGRIRLNLLTFWLKPLYHLKIKESEGHKAEFARLIMAYVLRKPRGFDKGFRILSWSRLVPALRRALQCYYAEMTLEQRKRLVGDDEDDDDDDQID